MPLFETILDYIPAPDCDPEAPFQMLVSSIDYNEFVGGIGLPEQPVPELAAGDVLALLTGEGRVVDGEGHFQGWGGEVEGKKCEPIERVVIDVPADCVGAVMEKLGARKGEFCPPPPGRPHGGAKPGTRTPPGAWSQ